MTRHFSYACKYSNNRTFFFLLKRQKEGVYMKYKVHARVTCVTEGNTYVLHLDNCSSVVTKIERKSYIWAFICNFACISVKCHLHQDVLNGLITYDIQHV